MKFCFVCGKKTEKLNKGYCEDCYNKKFDIIQVPESLTVEKCSKCNKIKYQNLWQDVEIEDVIKSKIKFLGKMSMLKVEGNKIFVSGMPENANKSKEEKHEVRLKIEKMVCPMCCNRLGGYYETLIQLRGHVSNVILDFIDAKVNETSFYRTDKVKDGFNLYIGDKSVANQIADYMDKRYKFKIKRTYKLFTKKEGRDIYKCIILIDCD